MGRRSFKKVTTNGSVTLHQRYLYRGYLQIACIDLTRSHHPGLWLITWDPTQPVATRPLAIQINGTWHSYGIDLTKNICELYGTNGSISRSYTYTPFGQVTTSGSVSQPIQWSCEVWDSVLGLVYYNWRYYNPLKGRWFEQDNIPFSTNEYIYCRNSPLILNDLLGQVEIITEQKGQKSNCLGGAMTGKKGEYRYPVPGKGEAKKDNFIKAMKKHNWDCYKVNMYQECLCESDAPKILISLWKANSSYYKNRNPWTDHTFPWNRSTVDIHAIRSECGTSHDYVEIPSASTEIQEFKPVTDFSLFSSNHHLLCCCYINNQKKTSKKKKRKKK